MSNNNKPIQPLQLKYFNKAAWYAHRGHEFSMQPNFAPTTQNGGASPQQVSQWNYHQCRLAIDAALALWHSLTNMFI